jgi:hypothetical protein
MTRPVVTLSNGSYQRRQKNWLTAPEFAVQAGQPFAWKQCREEILKSLTDVTLTARFLALSRLRRKQGSSAKLWVSQVLMRRALLEDPQLPTPITLPETLYLELTLGQMSPAETTVFNLPAIGDDLSEKNVYGDLRYTMAKLKRAVDACSNPPPFRARGLYFDPPKNMRVR